VTTILKIDWQPLYESCAVQADCNWPAATRHGMQLYQAWAIPLAAH
jgi:hypothetical protein